MSAANLFIIGAPKCGTTSLMAWLRQHPDVYSPYFKEPHHYYSPYGPPRTRANYEALYAEAPARAQVLLDSSVWYLFGRTAVPKIVAENPDARFVVCVRDPVEMVSSLHAQKLLTGHEKYTHLRDAWEVADARAAGDRIGVFGIPHGDPSHMSYKAACRLGEQVDDLLRVTEEERVQIVLLEDIATDAEGTWQRLCDHAGLDAVTVDYERANIARLQRRSQLCYRILQGVGSAKQALGMTGKSGLLAPLHRLNIRSDRYRPPPPDLVEDMARYFRDDVHLLESVIGRDLGHWAPAAAVPGPVQRPR